MSQRQSSEPIKNGTKCASKAHAKCRKTGPRESQLVLVLLLLMWKSGTVKFFNPICGVTNMKLLLFKA